MHTESAISFIQRPSHLCPPTQQNFKNLHQSKINILGSLCHSVDLMGEPFLAIKAQEKPRMKLTNTEVSTERKKPEMHILLVPALNLQGCYVQMMNIITLRIKCITFQEWQLFLCLI